MESSAQMILMDCLVVEEYCCVCHMIADGVSCDAVIRDLVCGAMILLWDTSLGLKAPEYRREMFDVMTTRTRLNSLCRVSLVGGDCLFEEE